MFSQIAAPMSAACSRSTQPEARAPVKARARKAARSTFASVEKPSRDSDQYTPFSTQLVDVGIREPTFVLDGLLYHDSELEIAELSTDRARTTSTREPARR